MSGYTKILDFKNSIETLIGLSTVFQSWEENVCTGQNVLKTRRWCAWIIIGTTIKNWDDNKIEWSNLI